MTNETKTYAITEEQRERFEAVLNDSIDSIIQEAHDFEKMWCDPDGNVIETRKAKHQAHVDRINKHQKAIDLIESLPLITGEPAAYMFHSVDHYEIGGLAPLPSKRDLLEIGQQGAEVIPLYTHPQPLPNETLDNLLGQYWDAAHKEGETGIPQSTEANDILHKMRQLVKPLQPVTATMLDDDEWTNVWIDCSDPNQDEIEMSLFAEKIQLAFCEKNGIKHKGDAK